MLCQEDNFYIECLHNNCTSAMNEDGVECIVNGAIYFNKDRKDRNSSTQRTQRRESIGRKGRKGRQIEGKFRRCKIGKNGVARRNGKGAKGLTNSYFARSLRCPSPSPPTDNI